MKSRKMASALLSGVLCFSLFATPAFACSDDTSGIEQESISLHSVQNEPYTKDELLQMTEIFSGWENDELNEYIDYLASNSSMQTRASVPTGSGQAAWLAAAAIVEDEYPCVAALISSSVFGQDYAELVPLNAEDVTGLFQTKIKSTSQYRNYVKQLQAGSAKNGELMTFESSTNADLAYSLHSCTAYYTTFEPLLGIGSNTYDWYIYDKYDFAWDEEYNSPFISLVNNAAYLSQQIGALNEIDVYIHFVPVSEE